MKYTYYQITMITKLCDHHSKELRSEIKETERRVRKEREAQQLLHKMIVTVEVLWLITVMLSGISGPLSCCSFDSAVPVVAT